MKATGIDKIAVSLDMHLEDGEDKRARNRHRHGDDQISRDDSAGPANLDESIRPSERGLGKLDLDTERLADQKEGADRLTVIIKVAEAGYVPQGIHLRARIEPDLFTAAIKKSDLSGLQSDPLVVSVSVGKRLRPLDH